MSPLCTQYCIHTYVIQQKYETEHEVSVSSELNRSKLQVKHNLVDKKRKHTKCHLRIKTIQIEFFF